MGEGEAKPDGVVSEGMGLLESRRLTLTVVGAMVGGVALCVLLVPVAILLAFVIVWLACVVCAKLFGETDIVVFAWVLICPVAVAILLLLPLLLLVVAARLEWVHKKQSEQEGGSAVAVNDPPSPVTENASNAPGDKF